MNNFYIYFSAVISIASQFNNQYFKFFYSQVLEEFYVRYFWK